MTNGFAVIVQSLSHVWLFVTPWTAAHQAFLPFTSSQTLLKLMSIEMTNLDSIFKSRDFTLPIKVRIVKAMVFLVVMYGCESWTVKKSECWRINAFELWSWRRPLRVPWIVYPVPWPAWRSNQSILKEINPEYSLEGLTLKLKYFGYLIQRADSLEKMLMLSKTEGARGDNRGWDGWMASSTQWTWVWVDSGSWWWTGRPAILQFMGWQSRTQLSYWTELNWQLLCYMRSTF